ncbi:hypothetical protein SISSUDRAFT_1046260 [Sistotremastrum suecicum HHB10207 ss-3]|uniref:RING-type domain-containing protein n=1 Tax=Sistotremastrum suecicum HHB10207 ss-3 TaxID=1314776 RepID=A0A166DVI5_9AGAM|nr:hypothetical protein SISSUDRAFT_1046260 [Sistotremastrum suecicum HHB10207 ss-3]
MTKHSKNNTASSIFSYAEYKKLDYGSKRQRLGNESMRRFDACSLCLQRAREPHSCQDGHIYCKECIYTDLLEQKKTMKRQKAKIEALKKEEEEEKERVRAAARERVLRDFEKGQVGIFASGTRDTQGASEKKDNDDSNQSRGVKRKFDFDKDKFEVIAREEEEAAMRQIEKEQAEARKAKLPDFWLPSLTPQAKETVLQLKDVKLQTVCRAGDPAHPLALKNLVAVSFTPDTSQGASPESVICPSCKRGLSNNVLISLMKPCSHVICKTCHDTLVKPSKQCVVCDVKIDEKDAVELKREGTGFAGGGLAEAKKAGVAFQG